MALAVVGVFVVTGCANDTPEAPEDEWVGPTNTVVEPEPEVQVPENGEALTTPEQIEAAETVTTPVWTV